MLTRLAAGAAGLLVLLATARPDAHAQTPTVTWDWAARGASSGASTASNVGLTLQADAAGNTYAVGSLTGSLTLGSTTLTALHPTTGYVVKYTPAGQVAWVCQPSSPSREVNIYDVATDAAGNVYFVGKFYGNLQVGALSLSSPVFITGFVAKLDAQGTPQWLARLGGAAAPADGSVVCNGLAVDAAGNLAVSGWLLDTAEIGGHLLTIDPITYGAQFIAYFPNPGAALGPAQWVTLLEASGAPIKSMLRFDGAGGVLLGTTANGEVRWGSTLLPDTGGSRAPLLVKANAAGVPQWAVRLPTPAAAPAPYDATLTGVTVDATGNATLLAGYRATGSSPSATWLMAQYAAQGTPRWSQELPTPSANLGFSSLRSDAAGTLYLAGALSGTYQLGATTLTAATPASMDAYLLVYTGQGTLRGGAAVSSGSGLESLMDIAVAPSGRVHALGTARDAAQLGSFALPATGSGFEMMLGRFGVATLTGTQPAAASLLQVTPNPVHGPALLTLPAAPAPQPLTLLDALGRPVRHYTVPAGATSARLDVTGLPAGLYVLRGAGAARKLVVE